MSTTRRYNQPIAARKRCSAEKAAPRRQRFVVAHDRAALKLGVGENSE